MSGILGRIGMGRLGRLGLEPAQSYERQRSERLHAALAHGETCEAAQRRLTAAAAPTAKRIPKYPT
jgi:hypothetical protein